MKSPRCSKSATFWSPAKVSGRLGSRPAVPSGGVRRDDRAALEGVAEAAELRGGALPAEGPPVLRVAGSRLSVPESSKDDGIALCTAVRVSIEAGAALVGVALELDALEGDSALPIARRKLATSVGGVLLLRGRVFGFVASSICEAISPLELSSVSAVPSASRISAPSISSMYGRVFACGQVDFAS